MPSSSAYASTTSSAPPGRHTNLTLTPTLTQRSIDEQKPRDDGVLGHSISPAGLRPNAEKASALTQVLKPRDLKQLHSLLGGLAYYHNFLGDMSKWIRPITSLHQRGANFAFTPSMAVIVCGKLAELSSQKVLDFPGWDSVADSSRLYHAYSDASIHGFGAGLLGQAQPGDPVGPIAYVSRSVFERDTGLRSTWKPAALSDPPSAFESTFGGPTSAWFRITRRWKTRAIGSPPLHACRKVSLLVFLIICPARYSLPRNTTAVDLLDSTPSLMMELSTSSRTAGVG